MSSSDVRMLDELRARVEQVAAVWGEIKTRNEALAAQLTALEAEVVRLRKAVEGEDVSGELYGPAANHAADREARAALVRRPPRA